MGTDVKKVTRLDISNSLTEVGIKKGDTLLTHSSLKSFGYVDGGESAVIEACKDAVGREAGTVVFPTLVQRDFSNWFKNWNINNSPSDVGSITEYFRKLPDSIRSDNASHSVAAWGKNALYITMDHSQYGPRQGPFGDYCFGYSSAWQRMYILGAKILFIGCETNYNTFKHFVEYMVCEWALNQIKDLKKRCEANAEVARYGYPGIWFWHDFRKTEKILRDRGLVKETECGNSHFICFCSTDYVDMIFNEFITNPLEYFNEATLSWWIKNLESEKTQERKKIGRK